MGFREEYLKFKQPSQERENFVFNSVVQYLNKDQIEKSMKPITVKGPNNTQITYKVMPDYVSIDGMRVPMSGSTAQRVATHFGFSIPNSQLSQKIYENADVKVSAKPLSGQGAVIDGKTYSGKDVVSKGVGYADFAAKYNDNVNQQLADSGAKQGDIVAGFAKDVVTSPKEDRLGLHGFYDDKGRPIQGGDGTTPHDTKIHTEYGAFVRLVSDEVEVKNLETGEVEKKRINEVLNLPTYTINTPAKPTNQPKPAQQAQPAQQAKPGQPVKPAQPGQVAQPAAQPAAQPKRRRRTDDSGGDPFSGVGDFLKSFTITSHERRRNIVKRAIAQRFKLD